MQIRPRPIILFTLLSASLANTAFAQTVSPSFFGASTAAPAKAGSPAPSTPVMSKDEFLQKVTTLKANNEAQFQANLQSKLKPLPSKTSTPAAATPPAIPAPAPTPAASTPAAPASTPAPSGYTGFGAGTTPATPNASTPAKGSSGWNVTY